MSTPAISGVMATGLNVMLTSVSAGINFGAGGSGLLLLLSYAGVILGANLIVHSVSVRMVGDPAPIVPVVFNGARALAAFLRRNLAAVGLVMPSCAVTGVSGEARPVLCFCVFALFQLGLFMINIRVLGKH